MSMPATASPKGGLFGSLPLGPQRPMGIGGGVAWGQMPQGGLLSQIPGGAPRRYWEPATQTMQTFDTPRPAPYMNPNWTFPGASTPTMNPNQAPLQQSPYNMRQQLMNLLSMLGRR